MPPKTYRRSGKQPSNGYFAHEFCGTPQKVDIGNLRGHWRGSMLLAVGETQQAAGRSDEAFSTYRKILADAHVTPRHQQAAQQAIKRLASPPVEPNRD